MHSRDTAVEASRQLMLGFADQTGLSSDRASSTLPVDRRLRRLQPARAGAGHGRHAILGAGSRVGRSGPSCPRETSSRRPARRLAERSRDGRRRRAPDARGPAHRQEAPGARASRSVRRSARVGSGRTVFPLPHEMDARARSGRAGDARDALQRLGARACRSQPPRVLLRPARAPTHGLEDERRSIAPFSFPPWGSTMPSTGSSRALDFRRPRRSSRPNDRDPT